MKKLKITFKTIFLIAVGCLQYAFCDAQNLVPNHSFEEYTTCPGGAGELYFTIGWKNYGITPDYYNSCCTYPHAAGVPENFCGFQYAQNGNAYAGINIYFSPWIRDFIGIQLTQPLSIGQKYYVSFYVSLTLNSMFSMNLAFDKLGVKFSTNGIQDSLNPSYLVINNAHVYSNTIITDSVGWTNIGGSFIADSAYDYMIVGFFFDSIHSNFIKFFNTPQFNTAYYYLDNFYVSTTPLYISELNEQKFNIYPNPVRDILNIKGDVHYSDEIFLYDIAMNKISFDIYKTQNLFQLNLSELPTGIYLLKILKKDGNYFSKTIIINH